jgi:hypothetical protein
MAADGVRVPSIIDHPKLQAQAPGLRLKTAAPAHRLIGQVVAVTALMMMAWRSCQAIEVKPAALSS